MQLLEQHQQQQRGAAAAAAGLETMLQVQDGL
jgi:hypothetical protein